jgi:hypothetical protein
MSGWRSASLTALFAGVAALGSGGSACTSGCLDILKPWLVVSVVDATTGTSICDATVEVAIDNRVLRGDPPQPGPECAYVFMGNLHGWSIVSVERKGYVAEWGVVVVKKDACHSITKYPRFALEPAG